MNAKQSTQLIASVTILLIGTAYAIMGFYMPSLGDDLCFFHAFDSQNDCWYSFPRFMYRHYLWNNARMADMLSPVGLNFMPLWLRAISNGLATSLLFYLIVRLSGAWKSTLSSMILIALIAFTLRWDAIWMEYVATYNYVWSSMFALLALLIVLRKDAAHSHLYWFAAAIFCFIATAMHEALGAPLAIGMICYITLTNFYRQCRTGQRIAIIAFITGGLFTLTSPASYSRIGGMLQPESPLEMLLTSAGYVLILLLSATVMAFRNKTRLLGFIHSEWIIFFVAAILSTCFMLISGYGGRTGWFAQIFALIATGQLMAKIRIGIPEKTAVTLSIAIATLIAVHYLLLTLWQKRLGTEARMAIELYQDSPDGVIFMDYFNEPELPWYLLNKTHGVPDDDDSYYRYRMSRHYGDGRQLVILPSAFSGKLDTLQSSLHQGRFIVAPELFDGCYGDTIVGQFPRVFIKIDNREYSVNPFDYNGTTLYLYSPVDRDRGEK